MSTTTTITTEQLNEALNDYKIHLTGDSSRVSAPVKTEHHTASFVNPPSWPTDHYRIPPHRPVNRYLDLEQRPLGDNAMETAFLVVMFTGVVLNATVAKVWGSTGGPFFPRLFRYAIGGEW